METEAAQARMRGRARMIPLNGPELPKCWTVRFPPKENGKPAEHARENSMPPNEPEESQPAGRGTAGRSGMPFFPMQISTVEPVNGYVLTRKRKLHAFIVSQHPDPTFHIARCLRRGEIDVSNFPNGISMRVDGYRAITKRCTILPRPLSISYNLRVFIDNSRRGVSLDARQRLGGERGRKKRVPRSLTTEQWPGEVVERK